MKKLLFFLVILTLSVSSWAYAQVSPAAQRELDAWSQVQQAYNEQCPHSTPDKPLPASRAVESNDCYDALVHQYVMPVAIDKVEVSRLLIANKKVALDIQKEKIDKDEGRILVQENWVNYVERVDTKTAAASNAAQQRAAETTRQTQQFLQDAAKEIRAYEAQQNSAPDVDMPETTNCRRIGNQVQCTTF